MERKVHPVPPMLPARAAARPTSGASRARGVRARRNEPELPLESARGRGGESGGDDGGRRSGRRRQYARRRERVMESTRRELREIKAREAARRREKEERQRRERRGTPCGAAGEVTRDVSIAGWGADESAPAVAFSASAFSASGTPRATDRSEPTWNLWWNISSGS